MGHKMRAEHPGLCRPGLGWDLFPKSVTKSNLLLGKIFFTVNHFVKCFLWTGKGCPSTLGG